MSESKTSYIQFCETEKLPIHLQAWWLDAVCGPENWEVSLAYDSGQNIIGALPYFQKRRWGLPVIQLPPFTSYAGPWLSYPKEPEFKLQSRYAFDKHAFTQLIESLPKAAYFVQNFRPEMGNWLPFYWQNFKQSTRYTYTYEPVSDPQKVTAVMKNTLRSDLKKASKLVYYEIENDNWEVPFELNRLSMLRKSMRQSGNAEVFHRLHSALRARRQSVCFVARDQKTNEPHAALYLAYDHQQAGIILSGTDPKFKSSCAVFGLIEMAINWCGNRNLVLDFEGSMDPKIGHTFRAFGARLRPYFQVWKAKNKMLELLYQLSR
ncbi:MAG: hypothetical protein H6576_17465 [Lewinellaceae bacterium]|nr:hypothetical protein [Saprospiraceae bacterium]MCB9345481.1 hypothetical protein [Lewinellaceae bacterium]